MTPVAKSIAERIASPDLALLERRKDHTWTAHNIQLTSTEGTIPGAKGYWAQEEKVRLVIHMLKSLTGRATSLEGLRVIDLGCLEGGWTFEFAREGMLALGIEGRESNYARLRFLEEYFRLPNLSFELLDVKRLSRERHGVFDVIFCAGLLYHLDSPFAFLELLNTLAHSRTILYLDTHFAPPDEESLARNVHRSALSPLSDMTHNGHQYRGRWYFEYPQNAAPPPGRQWTAVSNHRSFWPCYEPLMRALSDTGWHYILDAYRAPDIQDGFRERQARARFFALRKTHFDIPPGSGRS
ncbi:MAG: DUF1698 domain-containing protein [Nitrospinae bacterium]|nr:DUF1698 domain-containing protein [Nitrospinota bacterium]